MTKKIIIFGLILIIYLFINPLSIHAAQKQKTKNNPKTSTSQESTEKKESKDKIVIQVSGKGASKEEALQDAFRSAVEKAFGVYIYSKTTVEGFALTQDKIIAISKGFIQDYQIVFENKSGDVFFISVIVKINADKFISYARENKLNLWRDVIKDASLIQFTQEKLKRFAELLNSLIGNREDILNNGYSLDLIGYVVDDIGVDYIKGAFLLQVAINQEFWNNYIEIINHMATDTQYYVNEGLLGIINFDNRQSFSSGRGEKILGIISPIRVHKSLETYLAQPLDMVTIVDKWKVPFTLYKNSIIFGKYQFFKYNGESHKITEYIETLNKNRTPFVWAHYGEFFGSPSFSSYKHRESGVRRDLFYKSGNQFSYFSSSNNESFAVVSPYVILKIPFQLKDESELKRLSFSTSINIKGVNTGGEIAPIKSDMNVVR